MDLEPKVSVIVPLCNYAAYIGMCIQSIINQDYQNWELIVVDDCSTDNSFNIAKTYEGSKVKVLKMNRNKGYSVAKNEAIIVSDGDIIVPLDADDMLTKNSLSVRVNALLEGDVDFVHGRAMNIKGGVTLRQAYKMPLSKARCVKAVIHAQGVAYKRQIHIDYGLYDENLRSRADKEMWRRIFGDKRYTSKDIVSRRTIKDIVAYYRMHKQSMMSKRKMSEKLERKLTRALNSAIAMRNVVIDETNTRFLKE